MHHHNLSCRADVAKGACPQVKGNHYDCHQFFNSLNVSRPIKLNIYALLPSSPYIESLNIFAYDVTPVIIAGFQMEINCVNEINYIQHDGYE